MATHTIEEIMALPGVFGKSDTAKVKKYEVVLANVDTLTSRELAAGFAFLVKKTPEDMHSIFLESDKKEESDDTIQHLERMSDDGTLDFSTVELLPAKCVKDMIKAYVDCAHNNGSDDLNLSKEERALFGALNKKTATKAQVEDILKQVMTKRFLEYQQKGLEGIAPYQRKKNDSFEPGMELKEKTEKLSTAKKVSPDFMKYSLDYPNSKPTKGDVKETFLWFNFNIDDKPTFSIVHKLSYFDPKWNGYMTFHRHFYVSRGHNSVQAVGAFIPVENNDSLVIMASRTSTDQVTGFGGSAKKAMGSRIMGGRLQANLEKYRSIADK